jgi:hypothetical protein
MKKSKHAFHAIREPFGKAGLTVAILALVLAMVGGAYAAGALSGRQKKEVEKIAKKVGGKSGPIRVGGGHSTPGSRGAPGAPGANGKDGSNGADGKSVEVGGNASGCPHGGVTVQVAGVPSTRKEICNGEDGETGFTETLPSGKTETGTWAGTVHEIGSVSISFEIPLAADISEADTKVIPLGGTPPAECENPGHAGAASLENPEARAGFLCVYVDNTPNSEVFAIAPTGFAAEVAHMGASTTGAFVILESTSTTGEPHGAGRGTWAVTAP